LTTIDDFIEAERAKMGWLDRVLGNYPQIQRTSFYAAYAGKPRLGEEKMLGPAASQRVMALIMLGFAGFFWLMLLGMLVQFRFPIVPVLGGFLSLSFMIVMVLRSYFFLKKYNYRITVNAAGIAVDEASNAWGDITETCIMTIPGGKISPRFLVIFKKDGSVRQCNLFLFSISNRQLGAIVEYYKSNHH